ncbi:MAG: MaoC family dehydratase [Desulfobacterales bacterium]|nr:MaoC family dehydratase [Desulfobacterales bacterium]
MQNGMTIDQFDLNQEFTKTVTITEKMVSVFAEATGDRNPLHLDEEYAQGTRFETRVAHGMLQAGILSGILGMEFPGIGTIYMSQTLKFTKPVFIGEAVTFRLKVLEIKREKNRLLLETVCTNRAGDTVLTGEARVMPPA